MAAALVSASTLASAYRAMTDFTPRVVGDRVTHGDDYRRAFRTDVEAGRRVTRRLDRTAVLDS